MAWRTVNRVVENGVEVVVQRSAEFDEYRARIVAPRKLINHDTDYYSESQLDCYCMAGAMARHAARQLTELR